ncbi:MAG: alpha/beta fold hydrolase, partial [Pedosphaera parvula]|nr:alpha/beta fold hydrolase [Pedosphaera parvula]
MGNRRAPALMQLHFQCHGHGFPLLILHGLLGSSDNWQPLARRFAAHLRVFTVDLRNHGRSPHDTAMDYPTLAKDLEKFIDDHRLTKVHLLGHSLGGKVAMQLALSSPASVEKLIVVDIAPKTYSARHEHIVEALLALDLKRYHRRREIEDALARDIPDHAVRQFLLKNLAHDEHGAFRWKANLPAIRNHTDEFRHSPPAKGTYAGPALFLRGDQSDYIQE